MRRTKGDNTVSLPNVFKALSDPVRREILLKLKQKRKMSAGEIAAEFDLSNATISYHLSTLKKADLIFETRYQKYLSVSGPIILVLNTVMAFYLHRLTRAHSPLSCAMDK